jgi:hypothetical protein
VSLSNIAHHCAATSKRTKMSNGIRLVVESAEHKLRTYLERYLNHTPSSQPSPWRRNLTCVYNDRLLESGGTSFNIGHVLECLSKDIHDVRCGVISILSAYLHSQSVRVLYPRYRGSSIMAQKSGYDRFPPAANG